MMAIKGGGGESEEGGGGERYLHQREPNRQIKRRSEIFHLEVCLNFCIGQNKFGGEREGQASLSISVSISISISLRFSSLISRLSPLLPHVSPLAFRGRKESGIE